MPPTSTRPDRVLEIEPLWSRPETAEFLHLPDKTLAEWASKGIGPRFAKVGKHCRYRRADVLEWLEAQMVEPRGAA